MSNHIYEIEVTTAKGEGKQLEAYRGDVLLIVNVASNCGFTPQYQGLEQLNLAYRDKGLRVLGFPCNDFGAQEPGTLAEIEQFCSVNYGVTFELLDKVHCIGEDKHPLYQWLTKHATPTDEVKWNFEKFLISRDGVLLQHYSSKVAPDDVDLVQAVKAAL
ncbi:MAG: glutathione peroxidase [Paenibacillaceae bacterium]